MHATKTTLQEKIREEEERGTLFLDSVVSILSLLSSVIISATRNLEESRETNRVLHNAYREALQITGR